GRPPGTEPAPLRRHPPLAASRGCLATPRPVPTNRLLVPRDREHPSGPAFICGGAIRSLAQPERSTTPQSTVNPWRALRGLPRGLWILFATTLVNRAGTMVLPFLALYLTEVRGFSTVEAGRLVALYGLGSIVAAPVAGWLCDRVPPRRVMEASLLLSGLAV